MQNIDTSALATAKAKLDAAEAQREEVLLRHIANGVDIRSRNVEIGSEVVIAPGAVILAGTILRGKTTIGAGCVIGPNTLIEDSTVDEDTTVNASQVYSSHLGPHNNIGPFTHVRINTVTGYGVHLGAYVETKNSNFARGNTVSHLTTGYIHHIIYNPDLDLDGKPDGILKEWWEFALPKPIPDGESLDLHVETLKGAPLLFNTRQQGSTLRVTTDNLSARLHGTRQALETLQEQGVEQIQFVTTLKTTTLSVEDLLAEGGSWFALEHDGLGSRRLSAAQAESLKCWRH